MTIAPDRPGTVAPAPSQWTDPDARTNLKELVAMPTVSADPDQDQVQACAQLRSYLIGKFGEVGVPLAEVPLPDVQVENPDGTTTAVPQNPLLYGTVTVRSDLPTVMLYAHYDVVRADQATWDEDGAQVPPFTPNEIGGRLYGRGSADDKSGLVMHLSALRSFRTQGQELPVNLIVVLEGEEETGYGSLDSYVKANPAKFRADVVVIADTGNVALGTPTITSSLRGVIAADVTVATLEQDVHSGMFGGPAPDAFMALVRMLDTLTDWRGTCAVAGLRTMENPSWPSSSPQEEQTFRDQAGVLPGIGLTGAGSITRRVAGAPSINVVGLDGVPAVIDAVNRLQHSASARISVRIAPDQDPQEAYQALRTHLTASAPYGIVPTVRPVSLNPGYVVPAGDGPWYRAAAQALADAYGTTPDDVVQAGLGGTIPTVGVIAEAQGCEPLTMILWGAEEPTCRIHSQPESVSYDELDRMIRAEVNLLANVGAHGRVQG